MREAEGRRKNAPSIGKSSNSSSSSSAVAGFCGSLDPEDEDGSASTDFAVEPEPSGAAAISESGGLNGLLEGGMRILRWQDRWQDALSADGG